MPADSPENKCPRWIARLREQGVKAAHPDDGWVSRERCEIHLAYPYFDDGLDVGDLLALGNPGHGTRIVKVLGTRANRFAPAPNGRWYFALGHKDTDLSAGEGEGLRARIEAKARELDGKASYENENFDRNVEKRGLNSPVDQQDRMRWATAARVYGEAADALRSLLDPKEEA